MTSKAPVSAARKVAKGEYIETDSGNKVSRRALITGTANITLAGKTVIQADVLLRGDLTRLRTSDPVLDPKAPPKSATAISIGRYTVVSSGCVIKPPGQPRKNAFVYYPIKIGDHVFVGSDCVIQAALIGSNCFIGDHCVLQPFCLIRENCKILPYTVVPPHMVIPPGSIVAGRPARIVDETGEAWGVKSSAIGGAEEELWVEGGDLRELIRSIR